MMDKSTNTLTGLLSDILRREKNSLELIQKLNDLYSSAEDNVVIEYTTYDGNTNSITIPSIKFLISEIRRLSENQMNLSGINTSKASIKTSDGSVKQIFSNELAIEPQIIDTLPKPSVFHKKKNSILNKFIDPVTTIKFDLNNKINLDVQRILVRKYVLNIDTENKKTFFQSIESLNPDHDKLVSDLNNNSIIYDSFDEIKELDPKHPKYTGFFDVLRIYKKNITSTINQKQLTQNILVYKLNSLLYKDVENNFSDVSLKIGDELIVNKENQIRNTRYKIISLDQSTNEISLKLIEGLQPINIGVKSLMINPSYIKNLLLECEINSNEYAVYYFKPVNPNNNIVNILWGNGIVIDTNKLIYNDNLVENISLQKFTDINVKDLKSNLRALSFDKLIPYVDAIKPSAPILDENSFVVSQINNHKSNNKALDDIKQKISSKEKKKSEINIIDASIEKEKNKLATSTLTDKEIDVTKKNISKLYQERNSLVTEFSTLVSDILANKNEVTNFSPKYSIRGFWNIPDSQYVDISTKTGKQEIIQFVYRYRYLKTDNTSTESDVYKYKDNAGKDIKASFSKWIEVKTKVKTKTYDKDGNVIWKAEDLSNVDELNINQLDIPISSGESVEFQVKSISEAGYPTNPAESEWSSSVIKSFPKELLDNLQANINDTNDESIKAKFFNELISLGVDKHIQDSFSIGENYFSHNADSIATDERTPENKNKSVGQVLKDQKIEIEKLKAILTGEKGKIQVSITDESGSLIKKVSNNETVDIFGGFYKDMVSGLTVKKGAIVNKLFYIEIENVNAVDLELLSYVPGSYTDTIPNIGDPLPTPTFTTYDGYIISKDEYLNYRKYWRSPIGLKSLIINNQDFINHHANNANPFVQLYGFQSGQSKGSFLLVRNYDLALSKPLYKNIFGDPNLSFIPVSGSTNQSFIWDESLTMISPNGNGQESDFCIHIDHPDLLLGSELMNNFSNLFNVNKVPDSTLNGSNQPLYPYFTNSKFANLDADNVDGEIQLDYIPYDKSLTGANINNFPRKLGFNKNDQYLIGKNTVGSFLFLLPDSHKDVYTGEILYNKGKLIQKGSENKVRIPLLFSCRMTDYYGAGSSGVGILGGLNSPSNLSNLTFAKKIGIDIPIKGQDLFSFDVRVEMQYKPKSTNNL